MSLEKEQPIDAPAVDSARLRLEPRSHPKKERRKKAVSNNNAKWQKDPMTPSGPGSCPPGAGWVSLSDLPVILLPTLTKAVS